MGIKDQPTDLGRVHEPVGGAPPRATPENSHPTKPFGASGGSPSADPIADHPDANFMGWQDHGAAGGGGPYYITSGGSRYVTTDGPYVVAEP